MHYQTKPYQLEPTRGAKKIKRFSYPSLTFCSLVCLLNIFVLRVRKKREVTKYDSEGSYITDESYSAFESEEEAPEPKNETKNKEE